MSTVNNFTRRQFITRSSLAIAGLMASSALAKSMGKTFMPSNNNKLIPTLKSTVDSSKLGITLMHEHLLIWGTIANVIKWDIPNDLRDRSVDIAVSMLNDAQAAGLNTFVDMMPLLPQYYGLYQRIADKTNINIIVSTGFYVETKIPDQLKKLTELQMEERMYQEVTNGFKGTNFRAGIIKVASDTPQLTDWDKKVYRAAARVQNATGVPIGCHAWTGAREQLDILMQNGANLNHINFAHIETEPGWEGRTIEQTAQRLLTVVKDGGYLLFNNFFQDFYTPWKDMVYLMRFFCDKGYANRIFISMDTNWQWKDGKQVFEEEDGKDPIGAGKRTYAYLLTNGVQEMKKAGFTQKEIDTFLINNPGNFFTRG